MFFGCGNTAPAEKASHLKTFVAQKAYVSCFGSQDSVAIVTEK